MKKAILLLACLAAIEHGYSEVYFPTGTVWTEVTTNLMDESYCAINTYEVAGDTAINEKNYRKILLNGTPLYALREQDDKVYLMSLEQKQERLAYDFAWEVGKTLYYQFLESAADEYMPMCTLQEITQLQLLDGQYYDHTEGYIRGIGSQSGIFQHMLPQPTNGDQISLLCFSKNHTLIYKNEEYANCASCEKGDTHLDTAEKPFPVKYINNVFYFSFKEQGEKQLTINNAVGHKVFSCNIGGRSSLPINNLKKGVYHYQITGNEQYSGTFIYI